MIKINQFIGKYLLYSIPIVLIICIWSSFQGQNQVAELNNTLVYIIWESLSWYFIIWFVVLFYFVCALTFSSTIKEMLLVKLARVKERDEREAFITGEISKKTFLATLSVLIFLLFISMININVIKLPEDQVVGGKERQISIGFHFNSVDVKQQKKVVDEHHIFSMNGLPLSNEGLLFLLLLWQIGSYRYFSRNKF